MNKKILLVSTSASVMNGHPTGLWLEELAEPFNIFKNAGFDIDIVSVSGGEVILDKNSIPNGIEEKYKEAYSLLQNTKSFDTIFDQRYDAILFAGGHGPLIDFANNPIIADYILKSYERGDIVAGVCHGVSAFVGIKDSKGEFFVKNKKMTAFKNSEEVFAKLDHLVPFALETELEKQGAILDLADDFHPYVVVDKNLITGQNPMSSNLIAEKILESIK